MILSRYRYFRNLLLLKNLCFWGQRALALLVTGVIIWGVVDQRLGQSAFDPSLRQAPEAAEIRPLSFSLLSTQDEPIMLIKDAIAKDLVYIGEDDHSRLLVGLRSSRTQQAICESSPFYISFSQKSAAFCETSGIQIQAKKLESNQLALTVYIESQELTIIKSLDPEACSAFVEFPRACVDLEIASFLPKDLLLDIPCRLVINASQRPLPLYIGSRLIYSNEGWILSNQSADLEAVVVTIDQESVRLRLHDTLQGISKIIELTTLTEDPFTFEPSSLLSGLKLRGEDVVVCKVGKQKCLLKKGDWLIKNQAYWKSIRTSQDLQRCLDYEPLGELLVFEGIEKKQDQVVFKGRVFSKMRTQAHHLELSLGEQPLIKEKKELKAPMKKTERQYSSARMKEPAQQPLEDEALLKLKGT